MALPSSGTISISQISVELGRASTATTSLGETASRTLAGVASGAISMSDFYGKSNAFTFSITSNQNKANLRTLAVAAGWDQSKAVIATLNSGVYIYSDNIGTAALTINGSWPGGVTFVNNGYVMGMGGNGGGVTTSSGVTTNNVGISAGGDAIALGVSCTIQNNGYIGGGGGGGGGTSLTYLLGGGGAGGGTGGTSNLNGTIGAGGTGGGIGGSGSNGANNGGVLGGGGGGRIMPGATTVRQVNGSNGVGYTQSIGGGGGNVGATAAVATNSGGTTAVSAAGLGGQAGGSGSAYIWYYSASQNYAGGGGGGWGASGGSALYSVAASGAAGGFAVRTNGNSVTWSATGTRYGGIG